MVRGILQFHYMVHPIWHDHGHDIDMHIYLSGSSSEKPSHTELSTVEKAEPDARRCRQRHWWNHWTLICCEPGA